MTTTRGTRANRLEQEHRVGMHRATFVGGSLIPLFVGLDWWLAARVYPEGDLGRVLLLRAVMTVTALATARATKDARLSYRVVIALNALCLAIIGSCIGLMAGEFGGLNSPYLMGMALVILIRSGAVPERFQVALGFGGLSFAGHLVALGVSYAMNPSAHAAWVTPESLNLFVANFLLTAAVVAGGAVISHTSWTAQQQIYEARRLGRYRLEAPLGRGGQNEVWLAWDSVGRRQVALKILRPNEASGEALALFQREASLASRLKDPRTVRILEFGASDDGVHYLAMEYLGGLDLSAVVTGHGPMPVGRALYVGLQLTHALEEAHGLGLVHRDVKPANVMLLDTAGSFDAVKLLDFGIARVVNEDEGHTRTGTVRGTPAYLAPECCRGEPASAASDVYGLGATLYYLLTGTPPFKGSDVQVLAQRLTSEPAKVSSLRPELPAELDELIHRCMAVEVRQRFDTVAAVRSKLESLSQQHPWADAEREQFWLRSRTQVTRVMSEATKA